MPTPSIKRARSPCRSRSPRSCSLSSFDDLCCARPIGNASRRGWRAGTFSLPSGPLSSRLASRDAPPPMRPLGVARVWRRPLLRAHSALSQAVRAYLWRCAMARDVEDVCCGGASSWELLASSANGNTNGRRTCEGERTTSVRVEDVAPTATHPTEIDGYRRRWACRPIRLRIRQAAGRRSGGRGRARERRARALAIDPGDLRFAYRAPLASDGRGPVVFLVRLRPRAETPVFPSWHHSNSAKNNSSTRH